MGNVARSVVGVGVVGLLLLAASESRAQTTSGAATNQCGGTTAGWNVPAGDAVFVSGPGPVYQVLNSMGEYRSHSMLSHGPDYYVTHSTSVTPPTSSSASLYETPFCSSCGNECWNPLSVSFLQNSMPGLETVSDGGIYAYLYGTGTTENFIAFQSSAGGGASAKGYANGWDSSNTANTLANMYLGTGMTETGWWSSDTTEGDYTNTGGIFTWVKGIAYNGAKMHYGWYQYMNVQGAAQGVPGVNTGSVCSTSLAMWQHDALSGTSGYTGDVLPRTYAAGATLTNAANALWNGVQSECSSSNGWFSSVGSFFTNLGWSTLCIGVTGYTQGVCGEAADQMVNCFAANNCGNTSSPGSYWGSYTAHNDGTTQWEAAVAKTSSVTISPDDVACWNSNGTGAPCTGAGSSVWGWDTNETVQWNSGGTVYGCWD
jgi:hypothetical protein